MHATSCLAVAFRAVTIAAVGFLAIAPLTIVPAAAKTCKDAITAHARSSAQVSDETREKRARDKAISNWGKRAADTYGWADTFGLLGLSKIAMGWPLQVAAFGAMVWLLARGRTPLADRATGGAEGE